MRTAQKKAKRKRYPREMSKNGVLLRQWVVECTFAWILNAHRLGKDYEKNRPNSESMVYLAMIPLMLNRLR